MSDEATEEVRRVWNSVAPDWERLRKELFENQRVVSERLIAIVDVREGDTILELTAGPGETGLVLAERNPGAKVIVSDFAPRMVEAAASAVESLGLENVETQQIDAQRIDLPESSIHGVMSRYGLMLVPDREAAFSEIRRVLMPGRFLAYAVWGPLESNPWMMLFGAVMMQLGHFTPEDERGLPLTDEAENRTILSKAGFDNVDVEVIDNPMVYESMDQYWDVSTKISGPLAVISSSLTKDELTAVRATLDEFAAPFVTDSGVMFPSQTILVRAN
jgi:ubiquinone/menaquinone biosynthesis C-methylase UbiE